MGVGPTAESAGDDADAFNTNHEQMLLSHGCAKSGRSSGCVLVAFYCVTLDTWMCESKPGFTLGNGD